jgi:glycosyltransferase involved in cell wall biosynthesis
MASIHQMLVSNQLGGAGLIALELAKFFKFQSQDTHVWIPGKGPAHNKATELDVHCHLYSTTELVTSSRTEQLYENVRLGCNLYPYSPGIIHVHSPFSYRIFLLGIKLSLLKSIVHVHLEEDIEGLCWSFKHPPDLIITCAKFLIEYVRRTLAERHQNHQRIVSVPNAINIDRFFPGDKFTAKLHLGARPDTPILLMLANLAPHKGQETAIRVTAILREAGINVELWLAGVERARERSYTATLHGLANELRVNDQIHFLGHRNDAPDLLRAADILLLPSTLEGLPLSILEAQATKVPVLAASSSGIPEVVIDGETGFLLAADDAKGYADRIQTLLSNSYLYEYIAERAYTKILNDHTFQAYSKKISQLYTSLLNQDDSEDL